MGKWNTHFSSDENASTSAFFFFHRAHNAPHDPQRMADADTKATPASAPASAAAAAPMSIPALMLAGGLSGFTSRQGWHLSTHVIIVVRQNTSN
jgi:hypothetical protein